MLKRGRPFSRQARRVFYSWRREITSNRALSAQSAADAELHRTAPLSHGAVLILRSGLRDLRDAERGESNAVLAATRSTPRTTWPAYYADDPDNVGWWDNMIGPAAPRYRESSVVGVNNVGAAWLDGPKSVTPKRASLRLRFPGVTRREVELRSGSPTASHRFLAAVIGRQPRGDAKRLQCT